MEKGHAMFGKHGELRVWRVDRYIPTICPMRKVSCGDDCPLLDEVNIQFSKAEKSTVQPAVLLGCSPGLVRYTIDKDERTCEK